MGSNIDKENGIQCDSDGGLTCPMGMVPNRSVQIRLILSRSTTRRGLFARDQKAANACEVTVGVRQENDCTLSRPEGLFSVGRRHLGYIYLVVMITC